MLAVTRRNGALNVWLAKADGSAAEALTDESSGVADPAAEILPAPTFLPGGAQETSLRNQLHPDGVLD